MLVFITSNFIIQVVSWGVVTLLIGKRMEIRAKNTLSSTAESQALPCKEPSVGFTAAFKQPIWWTNRLCGNIFHHDFLFRFPVGEELLQESHLSAEL